jgi:eukaryotic-like serine/threonine-protein kinase
MYEAGTMITLAAGAYRLRSPLAQSAYGVLWRADGPAAIGAVALKLVNRAQMERAAAAQRPCWIDNANAEIAFLSSLRTWDQRHIVRLLDSAMHDGLPALALELLDGDLARHVAELRRRSARPRFECVLSWVAQINQALAKVHQYGWRYLDLKPANLLLERDGSLKLTDFGTSLPLAGPNEHRYTGTARWQAPEQFFPQPGGSYRTDARTDYFALGALLFYLVSGGESLRFSQECAHAFRDHGVEAAQRLRARHAGAPPTLLPSEAEMFVDHVEGSAPGAAPDALALLRRLLAPRPEDRPTHALDISRALARIGAASRSQVRSAA